MVYLLTGQDSASKDRLLAELKEKYLPPEARDFNVDILYPSDLTVQGLQEKLLFFPVGSRTRLVVLREAHRLKPAVKTFLSAYAAHPLPEVILVVDLPQHEPRDPFYRSLAAAARVVVCGQVERIDAFQLGRCIAARRTAQALQLLSRLLQKGEKPELIVGGVRAALSRELAGARLTQALRLLLRCDVEIKTGKIRADFALERLMVRLCSLA